MYANSAGGSTEIRKKTVLESCDRHRLCHDADNPRYGQSALNVSGQISLGQDDLAIENRPTSIREGREWRWYRGGRTLPQGSLRSTARPGRSETW